MPLPHRLCCDWTDSHYHHSVSIHLHSENPRYTDEQAYASINDCEIRITIVYSPIVIHLNNLSTTTFYTYDNAKNINTRSQFSKDNVGIFITKKNLFFEDRHFQMFYARYLAGSYTIDKIKIRLNMTSKSTGSTLILFFK